jgi:hypothetical protein
MWIAIAIIVAATIVIVYMSERHCKITCGSSSVKENMTAGLSTINGLSFYNKGRMCFSGNAEGSSDPFCTSPGYVLF